MDIKFTYDDFRRLKEIRNINQKYFTPDRGYSSKKKKQEVKNLQKPVWLKMKELKESLLNETYFYKRFDIIESRPNKQSSQTVKGPIRRLVWISLADRKELNKTALKHIHIPQMQISLQPKRLVVASIWLEGNTCKQEYKEQLLDFLENHSLDRKYMLAVYKKDDESRIFEDRYNNLSNKQLSFIRGKRNYSIGIVRVLNKKEVSNLGTGIYSVICQELQSLNDKILSPCYKFKVNKVNVKTKKDRIFTRKSRAKFKIINSVRKGSEGGTVTHKHREIQNHLKDYFDKKYKYPVAITKLEEDFVDLKIEFPQSNSIILYEIKLADSAIKCMKNGIGQLLFYNLVNRKYGWKNIELVIVGTNKMTKEAKKFITIIKEYLGKDNFRYQVFDEKKKRLLPERKS